MTTPMASRLTSRAVARAANRLSSPAIRPLPQWQRRAASTYTSPHQAAQISVLQTAVDKNGKTFQDNATSMGEVMQKITTLHEQAAKGGPEKARARHVERGKLLVRDRVTALIDPGSSFLELRLKSFSAWQLLCESSPFLSPNCLFITPCCRVSAFFRAA